MNYTLDTNAAKQADQFNARIEKTGKYLGIFTRAEPVTSKNGTQGIDFSFKSESGESSDYLTIWTHGKDGSPLRGFNLLMALMTCLRVKELTPASGKIEKYNVDTKKREEVTVPLFMELMNKPVGILVQMEEYQKTAGGNAWKPVIFSAFDKDEFVATEILNKSVKPEILPKMVEALRDKPMKTSAVAHPHQSASPSETGGAFADFEDDLPF